MDIEGILEKVDSLEHKLIDLEFQLDAKNAEMVEIARVGTLITSMIELDQILSAMMELSLRLLQAEVGCILVWENNPEPITKVSWGIDYNLVKMIKMENGMDIAEWTKNTGEPVLINEFSSDYEIPAHINSVLSAPLNCRNQTMGVLIAVNKTSETGFESSDKDLLNTIVNFASVAMDNSKLMEEKVLRQKLEDELELANEVQKALIPSDVFKTTGACIHHLYLPAGKVGGDYFDIINLDSGRFMIAVGDVSNKGVPAALMMTAARSVVRHEAQRNDDVAEIVNRINVTLCRDIMRTEGMFITLFLACVNLEAMEMTACNAGHLPPYLFNAHSDELIELKRGGIILGQFEDTKYTSEILKLKPSDRLLCYTDGITECEDIYGNMYGRSRLAEFVNQKRQKSEAEFLDNLKTEIDRFTIGSKTNQFDDITCVMMGMQ